VEDAALAFETGPGHAMAVPAGVSSTSTWASSASWAQLWRLPAMLRVK
jgi:hypothetical protein